ncbi:MAG: aspartate carbamoyltransferase [Brevinematales bacterium]|nr:aspartate carbamoyltransferase [Brevinematales bacterium]
MNSERRFFHILESQQFNKEDLTLIFDLANDMEKLSQKEKTLTNKILITLFYEPSTRTRLSFEAAMIKLGGSVISTENAASFSSAAKGETLEDTIRVLNGYGDVIVIRHFETGTAIRAAKVSEVPIINAGDGVGQHPTQSLLDLYTIKKELGKIDGISVALVGDLANGRTARSLAYLLTKYKDVKLYFVSPSNVRMGEDIKDYLRKNNVFFEENEDLREVASKVDVIYQTRIQRERFLNPEEYEKAKGIYVIDKELMKYLPSHSIVLHPLPRVDEIKYEVDSDPRAAYFRQAHNGLYIRMALLSLVLGCY